MMTAQPAGKIFPQMAAIMAKVTAIAKSDRNQQQGFNYRGIDAVYNSLNPILAENGVFMTSEVISKTREERTNAKGTVLAFTCLRMRYTFWADDGSSVSTEVEGEGMDSGDKSSNKAMAVAHKYALLQAFCIPTEELKDPDAESHEVRGRGAEKKRSPRETDEKTAAARADAKTINKLISSCTELPELDAMMAGLGFVTTGEMKPDTRLAVIKESSGTAYEFLVAAYRARHEAITAGEQDQAS